MHFKKEKRKREMGKVQINFKTLYLLNIRTYATDIKKKNAVHILRAFNMLTEMCKHGLSLLQIIIIIVSDAV